MSHYIAFLHFLMFVFLIRTFENVSNLPSNSPSPLTGRPDCVPMQSFYSPSTVSYVFPPSHYGPVYVCTALYKILLSFVLRFYGLPPPFLRPCTVLCVRLAPILRPCTVLCVRLAPILRPCTVRSLRPSSGHLAIT